MYLGIWCGSLVLRELPGLGALIESVLRWIVPPFARWFLGLPNAYPPLSSGSGDTSFNYATSALFGTVAVVLAIIWRRRTRGPMTPLHVVWWQDLLRLTLAFMLLSYGLAKVIPSQFPALEATRLVQPLGEFSPMGLLWAFMGFSPAYQMFGGWCEVVPGLLLLSRRTQTIGAMVAVPVLVHVVALNLVFDVPVKLHALHYLVIATTLMLPRVPSLWAVLIGRPVAARDPFPEEPRAARIVRGVGLTLGALGLIAGVITHTSWGAAQTSRAARGIGDASLQGIWDVMERSGAAPTWQVLTISWTAKARFIGDSTAWIDLAADPRTHELRLPARALPVAGPRSGSSLVTLSYARRGDTLTLSSLPGTEPLRLVLYYRHPDSPPLRRAVFRWRQDHPHNH